jgi:hypothetical protein
MTDVDAFEPSYSPKKVEFWLAHWEELDALVKTPKSSAHIAEHLNREWIMLAVRMRFCICQEQHTVDSMSVNPACTHEPSGGGAYDSGPQAVLCVYADLMRAAEELPPGWLATRRIWHDQMIHPMAIGRRVAEWRRDVKLGKARVEPEPVFPRAIAINRMAKWLGWGRTPAFDEVA